MYEGGLQYEKTISILSIIAIVLPALALLWATALLFGFWEQVCVFLYNAPETVVAEGPILPIGNTVYIVGGIVLIVVAYICSKSSKTIVGEIVSVVLLSVVLPILASSLSIAQTNIAGRLGIAALTALNVATNISGFARSLMTVATALCYVACGISISKKVHLKKATPNAIQTIE